MRCLDENQLARLGQGALEGEEAALVDEHLDQCSECRAVLARVARAGAQPIAASTPSPTGRVGRYILLERLGTGAMGVVHLAYDPQLDRRVALKLIRPEAADEGGVEVLQGRLLREARALAQLSHPNVVAVHDVGAAGDLVFIAMEYVEGGTARDWQRRRKRTASEVLALYALAGRGLAAAHAAGIVHRDFKPDNVLVGDDGRVRVADFGLARPVGLPSSRGEDRPEPEPPRAPGAAIRSLTRSGALVGSPAYMAHEVLAGAEASERSDVFSFCVALHEALDGARPFTGRTVAELRASIEGAPHAGPRGAPLRVRRALWRGLHPDPAQRWPSMEALLAELSRAPARNLGRAALALVVVALVAATAVLWQRRAAALCAGAGDRLSEIWGQPQAAKLAAAFQATGAPSAGEAAAHASAGLDRFAAEWTAMRREACEATRVRGEQSEELLDLRMQCLDRRLAQAGAWWNT